MRVSVDSKGNEIKSTALELGSKNLYCQQNKKVGNFKITCFNLKTPSKLYKFLVQTPVLDFSFSSHY